MLIFIFVLVPKTLPKVAKINFSILEFILHYFDTFLTFSDNPIRKRLMLPMSKLQMPDFGSFKFTPKVQIRDYQKRLMVPLSNKNIPLPGFGAMKLNINYD